MGSRNIVPNTAPDVAASCTTCSRAIYRLASSRPGACAVTSHGDSSSTIANEQPMAPIPCRRIKGRVSSCFIVFRFP